MNRYLKTLAAVAALVLLVSCGGTDNAGTPIFGGGASGVASSASNLTLQLSTSSIQNSGATTVTATATATTAAGEALAGIPVAFSVDNNATFTQSGATTGTDGTSTAVVSIGADPSNRIITVTATSGTLTTTAPFAVTGATLSGTASPAVTPPSSPGNQVIFTLTDANANPMTGQAISIDAGVLGTTTGTTDVNGKFVYSYTAPGSPGPLAIVATAGGTTNTQTVLVQSTGTVPAATGPIQSASVAANPSVVSTNTSATSNQTEIRALFVGPNNAPIQNVRVVFDLNGDPNSVGGTFATGTNVVYSDANGAATTSYIPGTRSSPTNGLTIRACYSTTDFPAGTCPFSATTTITVVSNPLSVSIGSNAVVLIGPANLTYIRQFVVLVVDASGNAKANVNIVPSIDLDYFFKGRYVSPGAWFQGIQVPGVSPPQFVATPPFRCLAEDLNRNGVLEAGEDVNHSGALEPRKSDATVTIIGNGQTDSHGSATVQVEYAKNVGSWLHVNILVSATGVSGTEGRAVWSEVLPVPIVDVNNSAAPPFEFSPYGIDISGDPILPGDPRLSLDSSGQHSLFPDGTVPPGGLIDPCHNPY